MPRMSYNGSITTRKNITNSKRKLIRRTTAPNCGKPSYCDESCFPPKKPIFELIESNATPLQCSRPCTDLIENVTFTIEGATGPVGPAATSVDVMNGDRIRFWSSDFAINVTPGSANIEINTLGVTGTTPCCVIVDGVGSGAFHYASINDAVTAGYYNICVTADITESATVTGPGGATGSMSDLCLQINGNTTVTFAGNPAFTAWGRVNINGCGAGTTNGSAASRIYLMDGSNFADTDVKLTMNGIYVLSSGAASPSGVEISGDETVITNCAFGTGSQWNFNNVGDTLTLLNNVFKAAVQALSGSSSTTVTNINGNKFEGNLDVQTGSTPSGDGIILYNFSLINNVIGGTLTINDNALANCLNITIADNKLFGDVTITAGLLGATNIYGNQTDLQNVVSVTLRAFQLQTVNINSNTISGSLNLNVGQLFGLNVTDNFIGSQLGGLYQPVMIVDPTPEFGPGYSGTIVFLTRICQNQFFGQVIMNLLEVMYIVTITDNFFFGLEINIEDIPGGGYGYGDDAFMSDCVISDNICNLSADYYYGTGSPDLPFLKIIIGTSGSPGNLTILNCVFNGNDVFELNISGTNLADCIINDNKLSALLGTGDIILNFEDGIALTQISNNVAETLSITSNVGGCTINGNNLSIGVTGDVNDTTFNGNNAGLGAIAIAGTTTGCVITNNIVPAGTTTTTSGTGNIIVGNKNSGIDAAFSPSGDEIASNI